MFKKLLEIFKTEKSNQQQTKKKSSKSKIESTRIGELGEHKINIQLCKNK